MDASKRMNIIEDKTRPIQASVLKKIREDARIRSSSLENKAREGGDAMPPQPQANRVTIDGMQRPGEVA